jgi:hypothetical protein
MNVVGAAPMTARTPLKTRILSELRRRRGRMQYHDLMTAVFPFDEYPRAFRCAVQGGPPGCAMAFGRALRELGCVDTGMGSERMVYSEPPR